MREHRALDVGVGVGAEAGGKRVGALAVAGAAAVGDAQTERRSTVLRLPGRYCGTLPWR